MKYARKSVVLLFVAAHAAFAQESSEDLDLVELLRLGNELKVVSASQVAEPVREAPVPVTIITREMIEASGARNLLELLTLYVPGMTRAEDQNELQVAMRGIYGSAQQKILIMLDGHRLNSRAYSAADTDFGIALAQLKRIEVLRGPGSSIYGNVALTAVINLVSLEGAELNGVRIRGSVGNYGQVAANVVAGNDFGRFGDILLWGAFYGASGQWLKVYADPLAAGVDPRLQNYSAIAQDGFAILGAARDPMSSDWGVKYRLGSVHVLFQHAFGKHTPPYSDSGTTGEAYRFDLESKHLLMGTGPGLGQAAYRTEIGWNDAFLAQRQLHLSATAYYDATDRLSVSTSNALGNMVAFGWRDENIGAIVQGRYDYSLGVLGKGGVSLGGQWEFMRVYSPNYPSATDYVWSGFNDKTTPLLEPGREIIYSAFAMVKHTIAEFVILNVGARFDDKFRHDGPNVSNFSPRLALILAPKGPWDLRLSYSESFVDAPYWYRYNSQPSYRGARDLTPEQMRSVQLTGSLALFDARLHSTLNLFYNDLFNFIFRNNNALPTEPIYQNAGFLHSLGVEAELSWSEPWLRARFMCIYQRPIEAQGYAVTGAFIHNIAPFSGALSIDAAPLHPLTDKLWLHAAGRFGSNQLSPINLTFKDATGNVLASWVDPNRRVDGSFIVDLGLRLKGLFIRGLFVQATIYNLLDTFTEQGGSTVHPYPQTGRWFLATLGYDYEL